jgi:23S rRNA (guanosine2251-2'-O)-methyltransferase
MWDKLRPSGQIGFEVKGARSGNHLMAANTEASPANRRTAMGKESERSPGLTPGFHSVKQSLLLGSEDISAIWLREGKRGRRTEEIIQLAQAKEIPVCVKRAEEFENIARGINHQGILAFCKTFAYSNLEHVLESASKLPGTGLLIAVDHITDEGNLGAIIRTCAFFGVHGLILPKDRSAGVTGRVIKRCAGTHHYLPIARVVNLGRALDFLTGKGFWIIGAAGESPQSIYRFDWARDVVLVVGNESTGLSPSARKRCHELISVPGSGSVDSLNVSVAAGIILSEVCRRRKWGEPGPWGSLSK